MRCRGAQDYELLTPLRSNRLVSVFAARGDDQTVVELRLLSGEGVEAAERQRLIRHWKLVRLVQHPAVRRIVEVVPDHDPPFGVFESVPVESCADRHQRQPLTQTQILRLGAKLAEVLTEAHRLGFVAGAISPALIFDRSGDDWILDLSKCNRDSDSLQSGLLSAASSGLRYIAPEVVGGQIAEPASDVYSLCAVLSSFTDSQIGDWPPDERRLAALVTRGLSADPDRRPSLNELARELELAGNAAAVRYHSLVAQTILPDSIEDDRPRRTPGGGEVSEQRTPGPVDAAGQLASTMAGPTLAVTDVAAIPETLGRFRLHERLGEGAVGAVYRATDLSNGDVVAVKILNARLAGNPVVLRRFAKEARMLAQAGNPFVANLVDSNSDQDLHFLVIEFVAGGTLSGLLGSGARLSEHVALRLILDAARGLAVAHLQSIVHRDIKPDNILLTTAGAEFGASDAAGKLADAALPLLKLSDFGLARADQQSDSLAITQDGTILGTPLYMSPEQCRGQLADARSDIYSLGATLFHMLAGRPPFQGENHIAVMNQHCQAALPSLRQLCPELSDAAVTVVEKCLAKNPDARYADASALQADLERLLHGEPTSMLLHPATPSAIGGEILEFSFQCDLTASPARLWPYVSHTDRVNHAVGLPTVTYTTRTDPQRGVERFAEVKVFGQKMVWQEHPYEWIEGRRLSVLREFSRGPFLWFMNIIELLPASGGGTRLTQTFKAVPRNWIGGILAKLELGRRSPKSFSRIYNQIDGFLLKQAGSTASGDAFGAGIAMTPAGKSRLHNRLERLSDKHIDPEVIETLRQFLEYASDLEVARIRPLVLAERFGLEAKEVINACLLGAREGVLVLLWDILCPSCRIPADVQETLASLKDHAYCPSCDLRYEVDFAKSVELIFRAHPEIRAAETRTYCIGGPAFSAHVVAKIRLAPDERFELELMLNEGSYRVRGTQLPFAIDLRVSAATGVSRCELPLLRPPLPNSVPVLRQGSQVLTLYNNTARELEVRLERTAGRQMALTAAAAASIPLFREMFPDEVLAPGQIVSVTNITLLLAELCGANRLYHELGDGPAFGKIRTSLQRMEEAVRTSGGAVVKIVGEGIVATFSDSASALNAAVSLLQPFAFDESPRRLAMHRGPALVTTLNDRLDYFGETVNFAWQLLEAAQPDELLLTASTMSQGDLASTLQDHPVAIETADFTLPDSATILLRCHRAAREVPAPSGGVSA